MTISKDKKQINAIIPIEDAEKLKTLADQEGSSVSQVAGQFIREGLERKSEQEKKQ